MISSIYTKKSRKWLSWGAWQQWILLLLFQFFFAICKWHFCLTNKHSKENKEVRKKEICVSLSTTLHCHSKWNAIVLASTRIASHLLLTVWSLIFMGDKQKLFPMLSSHVLNLIHWLVPDFTNWTFFFWSHAWMYTLILPLNLMEKKIWPNHVSTFLWVKPQSLLFKLLVAYEFICSFGKGF